MAYPTVKVEISLTSGDGPYTASPSWTDVTQWTREISINRGRASDFEHFAPGSAQLTLDNRDNRFTPFNLSGPYVTTGVSQLTPRRQIQITATAGGTAIPVFRGYVSGWPVRWTSAGQDSTVTIDCFDTIGLLGNTDIVPDWSYPVISALSPIHWWRLNEPEGSTTFSDIGSSPRPLSATSTGVFKSAPPLGLGIPFRSAQLSNAAIYSNGAGTATTAGLAKGSISAWFMLQDTAATFLTTAINGAYFTCSISSGKLRLLAFATVGSNTYDTTYSSLAPGLPHHLCITWDGLGGGVPTVYIDGQNAGSTFITAGGTQATDDLLTISTNLFQEIAAFDKVLTAAQVTSIYQAGQGLITESTGARATRLLAATSLNSARYSAAGTYEGTVNGIGGGNAVIAELQKTSDSEGGDIYCDRAGVLQFTGRSYSYSQGSNSTAATFTDTGANLPYGTELEIVYDGDNLQNDITITTASGGAVRVTNSATTNGTASQTIDTYLSTIADATSLANLEATSGSKNLPAVSPFDVSNANSLANWSTILGLELLSKISITRTPTSGTTFTQAMLLNAITHQITPARWTTTLTGSGRYVGYFVLDVSKLDGTDVLA